jgi:hypothetical protein
MASSVAQTHYAPRVALDDEVGGYRSQECPCGYAVVKIRFFKPPTYSARRCLRASRKQQFIRHTFALDIAGTNRVTL